MAAKRKHHIIALGLASIVAVLPVAAQASGTGASTTPKPPPWVLHGKYAPVIDPANFVSKIDNRYFPLKPGTGFHYRGIKDGNAQTDDMVVTRHVKDVLGVKCTVVRDTVFEHGKPLERTYDWYAQDRQGNVWYFGEDSRNFVHGRYVKGHDSWEAGVKGAKPGIIMEGTPQRGDTYRQEYYVGHAEDQARVLGPGGRVRTAYRIFPKTLATVERSRLEPGARERKFYAAGVDEIESKVVRGDHERFALVAVRRP